MNREEAIAKGWEVHDTLHSMKRRSSWHDYHRKGTYMLTLAVEGHEPILGKLRGKADAPKGSPDAPRVEYSELGEAILNEEIGKISKYYPQVEVWRLCIMPEHLHMIVRIKEDMPKGIHLGKIIVGFKSGCNNAYWRLNGMNETPRKGLFESGYNDKILIHEGQLENWKAYLDDNPRRQLVKRLNPELFTVQCGMTIAGHQC